jgi:hypothetical protein
LRSGFGGSGKKFIKVAFIKMKIDETNQEQRVEELPDSWWYRVYLGVIVTTIVVITLLGLFSKYFSS